MAKESQSRYSIMDELSTRKIKIRQEIAKLATELDERTHQTNKSVKNIETAIKNKEDTYEQEYLDKSRELTVQLKMFEADYQRQKEKLESEIETLKSTYKENFTSWKEKQTNEVKFTKVGLDRFTETQNAKIKEQEAIFADVESSINDLKDMSKEQN